MDLTPVILESPYAGDVARNRMYAELCAIDCLKRGEAPMVSHLLYTQFLNDDIPEERDLGIAAGLAWRFATKKSVVYTDFGISRGMQYGIDFVKGNGAEVEYRTLPDSEMDQINLLFGGED